MIKIVITEILNFCSLIFRIDYPQNDLNCIIIRTTIVKYHRIKLHIPHLNLKNQDIRMKPFVILDKLLQTHIHFLYTLNRSYRLQFFSYEN